MRRYCYQGRARSVQSKSKRASFQSIIVLPVRIRRRYFAVWMQFERRTLPWMVLRAKYRIISNVRLLLLSRAWSLERIREYPATLALSRVIVRCAIFRALAFHYSWLRYIACTFRKSDRQLRDSQSLVSARCSNWYCVCYGRARTYSSSKRHLVRREASKLLLNLDNDMTKIMKKVN